MALSYDGSELLLEEVIKKEMKMLASLNYILAISSVATWIEVLYKRTDVLTRGRMTPFLRFTAGNDILAEKETEKLNRLEEAPKQSVMVKVLDRTGPGAVEHGHYTKRHIVDIEGQEGEWLDDPINPVVISRNRSKAGAMSQSSRSSKDLGGSDPEALNELDEVEAKLYQQETNLNVYVYGGKLDMLFCVQRLGEAMTKHTYEEMGRTTNIEVEMDTTAAIGMCPWTDVGKAMRNQGRTLWTQNATLEVVCLGKAKGTEDDVDMWTKDFEDPAHQRLLRKLPIKPIHCRWLQGLIATANGGSVGETQVDDDEEESWTLVAQVVIATLTTFVTCLMLTAQRQARLRKTAIPVRTVGRSKLNPVASVAIPMSMCCSPGGDCYHTLKICEVSQKVPTSVARRRGSCFLYNETKALGRYIFQKR